MGWEQRCQGCREAFNFVGRDLLYQKETDVGKGCYRQRGGRVMRETRVGEAELGDDRHFEGNWGLHFCDGHE